MRALSWPFMSRSRRPTTVSCRGFSRTGKTKKSAGSFSGVRSLKRTSTGLCFLPNQIHEFRACLLARTKRSQQRAGDDERILLFHAAHAHTQVLRFHHDRDAEWVELFHNDSGDLVGEALLNL